MHFDMELRTELDIVEDGEEPCLRVGKDGIEGLVAEYCQPVLVEGISIICWLKVLLGFYRERLEWGIKNVGRVESYIYILASCL